MNTKINKIALFISLLIAFLTLDYFLLVLMGPNVLKGPNFMTYLFVMGKYIILILFFILYYHKYLKEKWIDFIKNFKKYFKIAGSDWLKGFLIMYISNIIIMNIIGSSGTNEENVQLLIHKVPLFAFLLTTIFAPIVEELIFRLNLSDCFKNKKLFMIISGLLFGFVHVMGTSNYLDYLLIIPYGALGYSFAHTLNKIDNIYPCIMMHAIHNGILTILSILVIK